MAGRHLSRRQFLQALDRLNRAIEKNPEHGMAYSFRGLIHEIKFRYDDALKDYHRAVELRPGFFGVYASRGALHEKMLRLDSALADFTRAIELDSEYVDVRSARGRVYARLDRYDSALADLSDAIRLSENRAKAYADRAVSFATHGLYDRALADLDNSEAADSSYALARVVRAHIFANRGDYDRALSELDAFPSGQGGQDAATYASRAGVLSDMGRYNEALVLVAKAAEHYPESPLPHALRGLTLVRTGKVQEGLGLLNRARAIDTNQAYAHYTMACGLALADSVDNALAALQRAVDKGFRDAEALAGDRDLEPLRDTPRMVRLQDALDSLRSLWPDHSTAAP
jgi:tetratricopeptide (TPR) repeat protein